MPNDPQIIRGILISQAAVIVESAFREVLRMSDEQLSRLSPDDKFGKYCDKPRLGLILDFVKTDENYGLPGMLPPRQILPVALTGITVDSAIRLLVRRTTDFAFYYV